MSDLLAVVPARGGSKGIPGKALRSVAGTPLLLRTLRTLEEAQVADQIMVSTDCSDITAYAKARGYTVLKRAPELADDHTPLADVAKNVVEDTGWTGTIGLFQSTCPLITPGTIRQAVDAFDNGDRDWMITVRQDQHLHWLNDKPLTDRVNRQQLAGLWCETGACQLMTSDYARTGQGAAGTFPISEREALDIDTPDDLIMAERLLTAGRQIHFIVRMGHEVGTGHFWRSLAIARSLSHHRVSWEWRGQPPEWARTMLAQQVSIVEADAPADLTVFDCLATDESELLQARLDGSKILLLEDQSWYADCQINALLDAQDLRYLVLREEFQHLPERAHREHAHNVLVTFGGTDPANLTTRLTRSLVDFHQLDLQVIRPGHPVSMAERMLWADVIVTSQGRTVLEAAAVGTPAISIAANEREARHIRLPGVTYLGLHSTVTDEQIAQTVMATLADRALRVEKSRTARAQIDGRGLRRLTARIEALLEDL
jgi:CMP-N-acetylneuraminic acid synthetase/spore coat polysaccharide biosynthesis predicted glycosyltransferase SpsG